LGHVRHGDVFSVIEMERRCEQDVSMSKRSLPPVGGGQPVSTHSVVSHRHTAAIGPRHQAPITLTLGPSAEAISAGRDVVRMIAEACAQEITDDAIERVATLRFLFPEIAPSVAEFRGFMDELVSTGRLEDVNRITREPGSRGRPRRSLFLVALVDQVLIENPAWSAKKAAEHIFKHVERGEGLPYVPSEPRIQNVYAEYRKWYALWKQSLFVPADILVAEGWQLPGTKKPAPELTATILPSMVVLHPPTGGAGIVGEFSFESLRRLFIATDERIPLVGADDPEFGPYSKYAPTAPSGVVRRCSEGWRQLSELEWLKALQRCGLDDGAEARE
jgi:hypothetical protein